MSVVLFSGNISFKGKKAWLYLMIFSSNVFRDIFIVKSNSEYWQKNWDLTCIVNPNLEGVLQYRYNND